MTLPDCLIEHGIWQRQYGDAGLDAKAILAAAPVVLGRAESDARAWKSAG